MLTSSHAFAEICFEDSYILGWDNRENDSLIINVECLLTDGHPLFESYDESSVHGCYKTGRILVNGLLSVDGLSSNYEPLKVNPNTHEYYDIAEIDSFTLDDNLLEIEADGLLIKIKAKLFYMNFSDT